MNSDKFFLKNSQKAKGIKLVKLLTLCMNLHFFLQIETRIGFRSMKSEIY